LSQMFQQTMLLQTTPAGGSRMYFPSPSPALKTPGNSQPSTRRPSLELLNPKPSPKQNLTPAAPPVKIFPARPRKSRKLDLASPPPSKRRIRHLDDLRCLTDAMARKGIKLLALDWDDTLISVHTRGQFCGLAKEIEPKIRPVFRELIVAAVASKLRVAIVSFSGQQNVIRGALNIAFPGVDFILRCSDKQWNVSEKTLRGYFRCIPESPAKLKHLYSAAAQLCQADKENRVVIKPANIVLIDDDEQNVKNARNNDVRAIQLIPDDPKGFLHELGQLFL